MNTSKIYTEATTPQSVKDEKLAEEANKLQDLLFAEGLEKQGFDKWLGSKETQALIKTMQETKNTLLVESMQQAINEINPTIKLTQANTIERIINYARLKTPIY